MNTVSLKELFLLFINFSDLNLDGLVVSYANDTCLLFSDNSWEEGVHHTATVGINLQKPIKLGNQFI